MASQNKSPENAEHEHAVAALGAELRNSADPAALAGALARIKNQKKLPVLVKHQSFPMLGEALVQKISEWEPAARAAGLSTLGRLIETVRTIRTTREVIGRAVADTQFEIPEFHLLRDAKERYYLAITLSQAPAKLSPSYLAQAIVQEDAGEAAREVLIASLLDHVPDLATAFRHLAERAAALSIDTKDAAATRARRLVRIAAKLRPAIATRDLPAGEELGPNLARFAKALMNRELTGRPLRSGAAEAALGLLYELVRARFSVVSDPETFEVVDISRTQLGFQTWPSEINELVQRIASQVLEGISLLARQGVTDNRMRSLVNRLLGPEIGDAKLKAIAEAEPGLTPQIASWVATGRAPTRPKEDPLAAESVLLEFDAVIATMMREIIPLRMMAARLQDEIAPQMEVIDPASLTILRTIAFGVQKLDERLRLISSRRSLKMRGEVGDIVEYSPTEHEQTPETLGARLVRIRSPLVERSSMGLSPTVVLKAEVDPA
ncbi:MAG: hypothetical protein K8F62_08805 [Pseudorhodoplanes sp.]|nr:hypothetical protein [Pseudorhodoplanes sp.]